MLELQIRHPVLKTTRQMNILLKSSLLISFTFFAIGCSNNVNTPQGQKAGKVVSLLNLPNQDASSLKGYAADSAYCFFLEQNHKICNRYLVLYSENKTYQNSTLAYLNSGAKLNHADSIKALNGRLDKLLNHFNFTYPEVEGAPSFVEYCGGYCEPVNKSFGIPILPDRTIDAADYWEHKIYQELFEDIVARTLEDFLELEKLIKSNKSYIPTDFFKDFNISQEEPHLIFHQKSTAEVVLILANIQSYFCSAKAELISEKGNI